MAQATVNGTPFISSRPARAGTSCWCTHRGHLAFWYPRIVPRLARERRVTVYDLRGHGMSDMPERGYTPADMADDLGGLLDHLRIERADLVGHSFGGAVCLEFAARHPERVRTLTLADATVQALQPIDSGRDWPTGPPTGEDGGDGDPAAATPPQGGVRLARGAGRPGAPRGAPAAAGRRFLRAVRTLQRARRTAGRWLKLLRTTEAWKELQAAGLGLTEINRIPHPTLLIYGERSRWLQTCQDLGEAMPRAERVIVPARGTSSRC